MIPNRLNIEFKVWDTKTSKFIQVPLKEAWLDSDSWDDPEEIFSDPYHWQVAPTYGGRLIWLQHTGLRTMSGEKIFDGDILSGVNIDHEIMAVVSWNEEFGKWIVKEIVSGEKYDLYEYGLIEKIIGNIYENQNLLQTKNT